MEKNGLPVAYAFLGNNKSMDFCRAFAKGCGGSVCTTMGMLAPGPVAGFWLPEIQPILKAAQEQGREWYYGDKAYFNRGHYWRITKNARMHNALGEAKPDRFRQLNLKVKPWRNGSEILICPQSDTFFKLNGTTQAEWLKKITAKIKIYSDRPIRIHHKRAGSDAEDYFRRQLVNAWAVVVHSSIAGVQAVLEGVPCFVDDPSSTPASFGSTDLSLIESPLKPKNREQMAWVLADNQWTIDEIRDGAAWRKLNGMG
jgi:hypothetical protein